MPQIVFTERAAAYLRECRAVLAAEELDPTHILFVGFPLWRIMHGDPSTLVRSTAQKRLVSVGLQTRADIGDAIVTRCGDCDVAIAPAPDLRGTECFRFDESQSELRLI